MAHRKEPSAVATPRRRRYGGGGPGKPFAPGTNSHDGQVFRRGSDVIPRGEITGLYRVLMQDDGEIAKELLSYTEAEVELLPWRLQLARSLLLAARDPRQAGLLLEQVGDRLEGRPVQKLRHELPHKTVWYRQGEPVPAEVVAAQAAAASADNGRSVSSHHAPDA